MANQVGGHLEVGMNDIGEVYINIFDMRSMLDANGDGHVMFSPTQARHLASLLNKWADDSDRDNAWRRG